MYRALVATALLVSLVGCSGFTAPKTLPVTGSVTWNGAPLADGDILFVPSDPGQVPTSGKIVDGTFEMDARPGSNKVEIRASRPGKFEPAMGSTALVPFIPANYNRKSTLKAEVGPDLPNQFTFDLREETPRK
jgi:hypothetical protein